MTLAIRNNSNAIAVPDDSDSATKQLLLWAEAALAAEALADRLCASKFAPAAYRGKVVEATAAIMAGAEVGLSPMAALRAFDDIQGTPAPKAITLRAIVQSRGHDVRIEKSTAEEAIVSARRKGDADWQTCTWTIDRAKQAGYPNKNPNWKSNPAAMLVARATAEVCRWVASDAIMGMPYSAEEIYDQGLQVEPRPAPRRVTASEILDEPATQPEVAAAPVETIRDEQRKHMFALWNELGFGGDDNRDQRLRITAHVLQVESVGSSNDLTAEQADTLIAALTERRDQVRLAQALQDDQVAGDEPSDGDES
jgi:hypothetical protein